MYIVYMEFTKRELLAIKNVLGQVSLPIMSPQVSFIHGIIDKIDENLKEKSE